MIRRLYRALKRLVLTPALVQDAAQQVQALQASIDALNAAAQSALHEHLDAQRRDSERLHEHLQGETTRLSDQLNLALRDLTLLTGRQLEFQRETRLVLGQMSLPPAAVWNRPWDGGAEPSHPVFPHTTLCRQDSFDDPAFAYWMGRIGFAPSYHRKLWEFMYIGQALLERGLLRSGARGLGFGVGEEPLTAVFAAAGCTITATDMAPEAAAEIGWVETAQHAAGLDALRRPWICPDPVFDANVEFRACDMNHIPDDLTGYDFCWSACALEHLGSIDLGLAFIERSLDTLKPGGFAIHTTEYNLSSNDETVSQGGTVLFRKRDIEHLGYRMNGLGHTMAPLDLSHGDGPVDRYIDMAPYRDNPHLKLALQGYAATSVGVIIQRRTP